MIKIAVFGNRSITDKGKIENEFFLYLNNNALSHDVPLVILHGGAEGPSSIVTNIVPAESEWTSVLFKPWTMVWSKLDFEPIYFYLRNKQIVENADKVVVFTNGERDSEVYRVINLCERWDKDLTIIEV